MMESGREYNAREDIEAGVRIPVLVQVNECMQNSKAAVDVVPGGKWPARWRRKSSHSFQRKMVLYVRRWMLQHSSHRLWWRQ